MLIVCRHFLYTICMNSLWTLVSLNILLLFLTTVPVPAQNLLVNAGFETGDLTGWNRENNEPAFYLAGAEFGITPAQGTTMFGGTHAYTDADSIEILTQTVAHSPGVNYHLSASVLGQANGAPDYYCRVRLLADSDGGAVFEPDYVSPWRSGDWSTLSLYFASQTATFTVGVELEQGYNHVWNWTFVDQISLVTLPGALPPTPTPTATPGRSPWKGLVGFPSTRWFADDMANLGVEWLRWEIQHNGSGGIDYATYDFLINRARDYDFRILGLIGFGTIGWDNSSEWATSEFRDAFAARARELAARYGDQIEAWEIWSEEDLVPVRVEPAPFGELLIAAYDAIKAVDPDSIIMPGGLANALPPSGTYFDQLFSSPAMQSYKATHGHFPLDAVAIHPYQWQSDPDDYIPQQLAANIRPVLESHGIGNIPIWFTEIGWNTDPTAINTMNGAVTEPVNQQARAGFITDLYNLPDTVPDLGPIFYFAHRGWGDQHFGLILPDYSVGAPSYEAYRAVAAPTPTPTPSPTITPSPTPDTAGVKRGYWQVR